MKTTILLIITLIPIQLFALDGYKELAWGDSTSDVFANFPDMAMDINWKSPKYDKMVKYIEKPNSDTIMDREMLFYDGNLIQVSVTYAPTIKSSDILDIMVDKFGKDLTYERSNKTMKGIPFDQLIVKWVKNETELQLVAAECNLFNILIVKYTSVAIRKQADVERAKYFEF